MFYFILFANSVTSLHTCTCASVCVCVCVCVFTGEGGGGDGSLGGGCVHGHDRANFPADHVDFCTQNPVTPLPHRTNVLRLRPRLTFLLFETAALLCEA